MTLRGLAVLGGLVVSWAGTATAAPPSNDFYTNATVIPGLPYSTTAEVAEAGSEGMITRCGYLDFSVWYAFTPSTAFRIESSALGENSGYSMLVIFAGTPDRSTEAGCSTSGPFGPASVKFNAAPGVTYYFAVGTDRFAPGGPASRIDFSVSQGPPPPDNDEIEGARAIGGLPSTDNLSTIAATTAADDPYCYGQAATVWYSFTPASDVRLELNTFGSDYGTALSVYTGSRGALTQLACNAFSTGPGARVRLDAQANVTYYIMVGWYTSEGGNLVLSASIAPPPFTFDLQLDRKGSVEPSTGVATVKGTASCSQPSFVTAQGSLQQEKAGTVIDAFFYTSFFCDGTTPWSVPVSYSPRLFRGRSSALFTGGRADATAFANAYSPSEGEYRYVSVMGGINLTGSTK